MAEKKETIFVEGVRFFKPRENAPTWIKGNVVINLQELREFIKKQSFSEPLMRIDLCKSEKKGTYYFTLNQWKPEPKDAPVEPQKALEEF
jgi:hypothetical protein